MDQVAALHDTIAELRERIVYLEGLLGEDISLGVMGFTPSETKVLSLLLRRATVSRAQFMETLYGDRAGNYPVEHILSVYICRIRPRLAKHQIAIHAVWGRGYYMPKDSKDRLGQLIATHERGLFNGSPRPHGKRGSADQAAAGDAAIP